MRRLFLTLALVGFSLTATVWSQKMLPDAPVQQFKLPMFGEDGYKIWDLQGKEGRYEGNNEILVKGMVLRTFSGGEALNLMMTIDSPEAIIRPESNEAEGEDYLYIKSADGSFSVVGRDWHWKGETDTIHVKQDVRVTFREVLGNLLQ